MLWKDWVLNATRKTDNHFKSRGSFSLYKIDDKAFSRVYTPPYLIVIIFLNVNFTKLNKILK